MSSVVISGNTSGTITLDAPAVAGTTTLTLPATSGTVIVNSGAQTIEFADGSAGAPSITNSGDTNTGMFFPDADTMAFAEGGAEVMRVNSSGNVLVGDTGAAFTEKFLVRTSNASGNSATFTHDNNANNPVVITYHAGSDGATSRKHFSFRNLNTTEVGSISCTGSATAFNTSSDYRLKENIAPMTGALATVAQLRPVTYTWKADGFSGQGFIAHELAEVVPDCVTGEKDAVDKDGNPQYQGIDTSFLVATLTAAIKEQQTIINDIKAELDNVKTELATLKGTTL
jgi:hypothetical protein